MEELKTYIVTGRYSVYRKTPEDQVLAFVADMLRYDAAEVVALKTHGTEPYFNLTVRGRGCTVGRWNSFGFRVSEIGSVKVSAKEAEQHSRQARHDAKVLLGDCPPLDGPVPTEHHCRSR